jgi:hypothetical protein
LPDNISYTEYIWPERSQNKSKEKHVGLKKGRGQGFFFFFCPLAIEETGRVFVALQQTHRYPAVMMAK